MCVRSVYYVTLRILHLWDMLKHGYVCASFLSNANTAYVIHTYNKYITHISHVYDGKMLAYTSCTFPKNYRMRRLSQTNKPINTRT